MRVKAIPWVGVKTNSYREMREFFSGVAGLPVDFESTDFTVFRLPSGDKLEIFGPAASHQAELFARDQVVASFLVEDIDAAIAELRAAGIELLGERGEGGGGYFWQHFRAPDGKVFELLVDPAHPQQNTDT
jgi:predicted enzyme related to lactoylglutathione lyase